MAGPKHESLCILRLSGSRNAKSADFAIFLSANRKEKGGEQTLDRNGAGPFSDARRPLSRKGFRRNETDITEARKAT